MMPAREIDQAAPLVSVIIPVYRVEHWLPACLESVLAQDWPSLEIILVDDASDDGSGRIAAAFAQRDARIRSVRHDANRGAGPARNTGIMHATGSWLLFLDADDLLAAPDTVSRLVTVARQHRCQVVIGGCELLLKDGTRVEFDRKYDRELGGRPGEVLIGEAAYLAAWGRPKGSWLPIRGSGILVEHDLLTRHDLRFPSGEHEDLCFTPILYSLSNGVFYDAAIALLYRQRSESMSHLPWTPAKMRRYVEAWRQTYDYLERFGLRHHIANTACKFLETMAWRIESNGADGMRVSDVLETIGGILANTGEPTDVELFNYTMDRIALIFPGIFAARAAFRSLVSMLSRQAVLRYYAERLSRTTLPKMLDDSPPQADRPGLPLSPADAETIRFADLMFVCHRVIASPSTVVRGVEIEAVRAEREATLRAEVAAANTRAHRATLRYEAVIHSKSWRVTAPFRWVMRLFRGGKRVTTEQ